MDHFGIGAALQGVAQVYFRSARRSGRTTSMVESLQTGDRVVFADPREAERVRRLCRERGQDVECLVLPPKSRHELPQRGTPKGRLVFDHTWLEQFYLDQLAGAQAEVDYLQREFAGYGEAHRETNRRAEEIARWRL